MANEIFMSLPDTKRKAAVMNHVVQSAFDNGASRVVYVGASKQEGDIFRSNLPKHLRACVTVRSTQAIRWMSPSSNDCVIVDGIRAVQIMEQWCGSDTSVVVHMKIDQDVKHPRIVF